MKRKKPSSLKKLNQLVSGQFINYCRIFLEKFNIDSLSKPYGVENIDFHNNLLKYIDFDEGFFIELGGYDGFFHSPTYYLEKFKKWKGILIEPHPEFFNKCVNNRSKSKVYNFACTSEENHHDGFVILNSIGHSSYLQGSLIDESFLEDMLEGISQENDSYKVKTLSLTEVLNYHFKHYTKIQIDLLCLDVEGSELNVLNSLDFDLYSPRFILCESHSNNEKEIIHSFLKDRNYMFVDKISSLDYLYKLII